MALFHASRIPAWDAHGRSDPGARWEFFAQDSSTAAPVFADEGLSQALGPRVEALSGGRFPTVYLDNRLAYRAVLHLSDGSVRRIDRVPLPKTGGASADLASFGFLATNPPAANAAILNQALAYCSVMGIAVLEIAPGEYPCAGAINLCGQVRLAAAGVTLKGTGLYLYTPPGLGTDGWAIDGLTLATDMTANFAFRLFDVSRFALRNLTVHRGVTVAGPPGSGGYVGMIIGGQFGEVTRFRSTGSNGLWIEGSDLRFVGGEMTAGPKGGDDCLVVKAPDTRGSRNDERANSSDDIQIADWTASGYAAVVSLGSEVGKLGGADSAYSRRISNVTIRNIVGRDCAYLLFIKPGANAGQDYRDGVVENVTVTQGKLIDLTGKAFEVGINIIAGRGAQVRNVRISEIEIVARAHDQLQPNLGIRISPYDFAEGAAASTIEDVVLSRVSIKDAHGGAPNGRSVPGHPIDFGLFIESVTGNGGRPGNVRRIEVNDFVLDGCRRNAVYTGERLSGPFVLQRASLRNFCHTGVAASDRGAFGLHTAIAVSEIEASSSPSAPEGTRPILSDYWLDPTIEIAGEQARLPIGPLAREGRASVTFKCPRDCWISKIEVVGPNTAIAGRSGTIAVVAFNEGVGSNLTAPGDAAGVARVSHAAVSIFGRRQFVGASALLRQGQVLRIDVKAKATLAAGAELIVHYVPYGFPR